MQKKRRKRKKSFQPLKVLTDGFVYGIRVCMYVLPLFDSTLTTGLKMFVLFTTFNLSSYDPNGSGRRRFNIFFLGDFKKMFVVLFSLRNFVIYMVSHGIHTNIVNHLVVVGCGG